MTVSKTVAIHQPNFFPWLGYFAKIATSDIFVFFDDVQFPKKGGAWSNRVKLLIADEARWATAAIDRDYDGTRLIYEMSFLSANPWRSKMLKTIEANYKKHPFYFETIELIEPLLLNEEQNIAEYNIKAVSAIAEKLHIGTTKMVRSSSLAHEGSSNELLCSVTTLVGGTQYMCGDGAEGYQEEQMFIENGIALMYQNFAHPIYHQRGQKDFVSGLSIIDAAMNLGWSGVKGLLADMQC